MSPAASSTLLQWFVDYFSPEGGGVLGSIVYEMFKLQDSFGRVMVNNLQVGSSSVSSVLIDLASRPVTSLCRGLSHTQISRPFPADFSILGSPLRAR
jgi:hypothetical protein